MSALAEDVKVVPSTSTGGDRPIFSIGLIADMHYMDAENGRNFSGTRIRRFRQSGEMLDRAVASFHEMNTACNIMLGDVIDGQALSKGKNMEFLEVILKKTLLRSGAGDSGGKWYIVQGNHECYNFTRPEMLRHLIPESVRSHCSTSKLYYSFSPVPGYRCIVLDGYEISTMGAINPDMQQKAVDLVSSKNAAYAAGSSDWFKDLPKENHRYVPFNGAVTPMQLQWLKSELDSAAATCQKCFLFCHMALYVHASQEANLLWNCEEVLKVMHSTPRGTVLACFSGHDHNGGYAADSHGVHHIVPPSPIECDEGEETWGRLEVAADRMHIVWTGKRPTNNWPDELLIPCY